MVLSMAHSVTAPFQITEQDDTCVNRCRWIEAFDFEATRRCWSDLDHDGHIHKYFEMKAAEPTKFGWRTFSSLPNVNLEK